MTAWSNSATEEADAIAKYIATPVGAAPFAPVDIAPATGSLPVTILQLGIPTGVQLDLLGWGISIAGIAAADVPFYAHLMEADVAASVGTSLTPAPWDTPGGQASLCVGGAALTCYAPTTENTLGAARMFDTQRIHPQTGYSVWFPSDARPEAGLIGSARYVKIRIRAVTTAYNVIPFLVWEE